MAANTVSSEVQAYLRDEAAFKRNIRSRHFRGRLWRRFFSTGAGGGISRAHCAVL
ncbi:MAG: hypothetical protein UZ15_CFX003002704 [Chloroflexi bacterium OLB15]|nr:MAG: hypothetical protein UZ15_CFX003002704 [Chloroflexi bacterium OLB15]